MMDEWIQEAKARGWGGWLAVVLDIAEPLGPLSAQLLWLAQPALGLLVDREGIGALAQTLEEPDGVARLRRLLEEDEIGLDD
jgi:hypothetical protein